MTGTVVWAAPFNSRAKAPFVSGIDGHRGHTRPDHGIVNAAESSARSRIERVRMSNDREVNIECAAILVHPQRRCEMRSGGMARSHVAPWRHDVVDPCLYPHQRRRHSDNAEAAPANGAAGVRVMRFRPDSRARRAGSGSIRAREQEWWKARRDERRASIEVATRHRVAAFAAEQRRPGSIYRGRRIFAGKTWAAMAAARSAERE